MEMEEEVDVEVTSGELRLSLEKAYIGIPNSSIDTEAVMLPSFLKGQNAQ